VGARLIVIEDNFPVAAGLEYLLQSAGCEVVAKAGHVAQALEIVANVAFDVALLDIDLHGEHVAPVAEEVRRRGKPLIFLSGYGEADMLPPQLRSLPRLEKPVDPEQLFAAIDRALAVDPTGHRN
jgi:DNA-binding NtrC family response regulator